MSWDTVHEERDENGEFTPLAAAAQELSARGCECGDGSDPDVGVCIGCICEAALHAQFDEITRLKHELAATRRALAGLLSIRL